MTEPGPRLRELLTESTNAPGVDHDRMWVGVRARQAVRARRKTWALWSLVGLAGSLSAAGIYATMRATPDRAREGPITIAADSIAQSPPGAEPMVAQQQETPVGNALIPLLGHRTQIRMDIDHLTDRRRDLQIVLTEKGLTPALREINARDLAEVEQQLAAAKQALNLIDAQLAGRPVAQAEPAPVAPTEHFTEVPSIEVPVVVAGRPLWMASGAIVLLLMITLLWVRRVTRATLRELASLRSQSSTQLTALSEGVEAIALEVERIGEGQRYLSKMIGTPNQAVAEQRPAN